MTRLRLRGLWCGLIVCLVATVSVAAPKKPIKQTAATPKAPEPRLSKEGVDFFESNIRPVLVRSCYRCHSGDPAKAKGQLALDTRAGMLKGGASGEILSPGHPEKSLLIEALNYEGLQMPPEGQLSEGVIADFTRWIEMGAPDPRFGKAAHPKQKIDWAEAREFWAFQRPRKSAPPAIEHKTWPKTDLDRFVLAKLEDAGLTPVRDADKETLLRRVTFDLTGLPPTPEEIDAFLKDNSSAAFTNVVDRLLASPRYGERWGRHWLDVVRYAESTGRERNVPYRYAWRYRNYVIDAFNDDKPYNRFILEQVAGDLLKTQNVLEHEKLIIATGFLALGPKAINTKNAEQFRVDVVDDQIDVTGRAFLGLTIACARCHDHKFDPIPTTDYYALAGVFQSTKTLAGVAPGTKTANERHLIPISSQTAGGELQPETPEQKAHRHEIAQVEAQLKTLRQQLKQSQKKPADKGQASKKKGKGKTAVPSSGVKLTSANPKPIKDQIKKLEDKLEELEQEPTPPGNFAMGVRDVESPENAKVLVRGELKEKGPEVPRGVLTVLKSPVGTVSNPKHSGRIEVANWIADKNNPLTARVMVNRVWSHLFGQGLVESVDNFGALGNEPSHPELLDMLAVQFAEDHKWSVKQLIRSIVLSRTYQLGSEHHAENYEADPSNTWLWRMSRRRLDAEEIRDAMLQASGQLVLERPDDSPVMHLSNRQIGGGDKKMQEVRKPTNVRSVYLPIVRGAVPEMLGTFDLADPNLIVGKRDVTTVPTQALFLMNNSFVLKQAEDMAKRLVKSERLSEPDRIELAYRLTLSRAATPAERAELAKYLSDYRSALKDAEQKQKANLAAWTSFCQLLFELGEFRYRY